jgi:hypothetical protein
MTERSKRLVFGCSVILLTIVHHALLIQTMVWAISAAMEEEGHLGVLSNVAVVLSWPADLFLSSPATRIEYGWIFGWVNSLIWGLGLTIFGWAVLRLLRGSSGHGDLAP